jgi:bifunctional non-homologous end joining protein LigD
MRAPIFLRFREDKRPEECIIETPGEAKAVVDNASTNNNHEAGGSAQKRQQSFTNLNKVFWNATSDHRALTKGDLVEYYDKISAFLLPHLRDRPLSLNRYPDGIRGKSFFHKNWHQNQPEFVQSIRVFSESSQRIINYILCNNKDTLVWLANLGCIEMHPWYSHVNDFDACMAFSKTSDGGNGSSLDESKCGLDTPDFVVFDLDPYIYSGRELKGEEPEYNVRGFNAAVHVALELKDLLDSWKLQSFVKTSGKTGLHVFVPLDPLYSFEQTRMFAELFGRILLDKSTAKGKITMEWSTARRKGKVFFDYNQNAKGKTVASVFSARPTKSATVSMPIEWRRIGDVKPTDFTVLNVPEILKKSGDPWRHIMKTRQDLHSILEDVSEANI